MLTQGWQTRAAFVVALVSGAVLVGARAPAPLAATEGPLGAAGEIVSRTSRPVTGAARGHCSVLPGAWYPETGRTPRDA